MKKSTSRSIHAKKLRRAVSTVLLASKNKNLEDIVSIIRGVAADFELEPSYLYGECRESLVGMGMAR